jgi:outer membrane protein OmpA-like peptidoglycan-associated protein
MNKCNICIISSLLYLFFSGLPVFSQNDRLPGDAPVASNTWKTGWHIDAGGGVQTLFSSDVTNLSFKQRFTPLVSFGVGKWINPYWGIRLQAGGYTLNGYSTSEGTYLADPLGNGDYGVNDPVRGQVSVRPDGSYRHYLRYVNGHLDVEFSLLNLLNGYKENRRWDIVPALGAGYLRSLGYKGTPVTENVTANLSLKGKFALSSHWDIHLEASAAALDGKFDGRITKQKYEAYSGVTLGISYSFSRPKGKSRPVKSRKATIQRVESGINDHLFNKMLEQLSAIEERLDKLDKKEPARPQTIERIVVEKEPVEPFVLASILFKVNSAQPLAGQNINLANAARYLHEHPETTVRLEGYGDRATGTPEQNLKISIKRADYVRKELIDTYGIASRRIETQAIGSNVQPYEKNEWNRLVLIIRAKN